MNRLDVKLGLALVLTALLGLIPPPALAARPRVALLPFQIHARTGQEDLARQVTSLIIKHTISPAMEIIPASEVAHVTKRAVLDPEEVRRIGRLLRAQWAVYGSLTVVGGQVSLDVNLLNVVTTQPPLTFYRSGRSLPALEDISAAMGQEMRNRILALGKVLAVNIEGNQRIDREAITVLMKTKPGEFFDPAILDKDIRAIYGMGYFSDVRATAQEAPGGQKVVIKVEENPAIREVKITGKSPLGDDEVLAAFNIQTYKVYSPQAASNGAERVAELYRAKGYLNAEVKTQLKDVKDGLATIILDVQAYSKVYIKEINFEGNKAVSSKDLRKQMTTTDWGIFSFITDSGVLKKEVLDKDLDKVRAYFQDNGFIRAQVGEPKIDIRKDGIFLTIPVSEGPQYKVGKVSVEGELIKPAKELLALLSLKTGLVFSRSKQEGDREKLGDLYATAGYAKVQIRTDPKADPKALTVDLHYTLTKGPLVYVERINIRGNARTRDKVVRREVKLAEGDLFDVTKLRRSGFNLRRLDFFESVDFQTRDGSTEDRMIFDIKVTEKPTASFNFGAGFSTEDSLMLLGNIQETNLLGRGQELAVRGTLGLKTSNFSLSFVEPWLFDIPLRSQATIFNTYKEYYDYNKSATGGSLSFSYPVWGDDIRGTGQYTFELAEITGISDSASAILKDMAGTHSTSSIALGLRQDTRDQVFQPTRGSLNILGLEFAGLGGSNAFTKYVASSGWYFPTPLSTTVFLHGKAGYIHRNSWGDLPLYEKFYMGGINSLRGFKFASVAPAVPGTSDLVGGDYMAQFNTELVFPIYSAAGIKGVVFYDAGNAWETSRAFDNGPIRSSVGLGVRWYSPIGPIRLEYGFVVTGTSKDGTGGWEFSIGTMF